jgi:hypothetical protein
MSNAIERHSLRPPASRLDGARAFSRAMSWICSGLSIAMLLFLAGACLWMIVLSSSDFPSCSDNVKASSGPAQRFHCKQSPSKIVIIQPRPDGTTVTTTTTYWEKKRFYPIVVLQAGLPLIPEALLALALWQAGRFFANLSKGRVLNAATVRRLRNFSLLGVVILVANPLIPVLGAAILKPVHREPVRYIFDVIHFGSWTPQFADYLNIIFATVLVAMVSVLARAAAIAEDHAQIV